MFAGSRCYLIAEDGAPAKLGRGVHRQHRHFVPLDELHSHGFRGGSMSESVRGLSMHKSASHPRSDKQGPQTAPC